MASYYFINTVVWLIFDLKHSEITQKKIKQFYYDNTMVNFCKGCDVHMFFVEEIIEAVSSIAKRWPKIKDYVDIWMKCLVNSLLNKDMIVL